MVVTHEIKHLSHSQSSHIKDILPLNFIEYTKSDIDEATNSF